MSTLNDPPVSKPWESAVDENVTQIRLLATTDLHMQLLGHDYVTDTPLGHRGLAGLATLIENARTEAAAEGRGCVLLDNGDFLQGNALGAWLSERPVTGAHPIVAAFNALRYDAVGLGNHDLDYGLPYLNDIARLLHMPLIATNLEPSSPGPLQNYALFDCLVPGATTPLRLGVLSMLPGQTATWNRNVLEGEADVLPPLPSLVRSVADLRRKGAELIVLLAHMGIGQEHAGQDAHDSAAHLALVPGVDAIVTGHTHRRFPGRDHDGLDGVDAASGLLWHRPAVMSGYGGSDLAVIDLTIRRDSAGSRSPTVIGHVSGLRENTNGTPADPAVEAACRPAHEAVLSHLSRPVGRIDQAIHNFFALATPTSVDALIARAKARLVRTALAGTPDADLPLLACTSAHTAGGRGGPDHYLHIAEGPVLRRHLAGLSPYANEVWALQLTGGDLRRWLEHGALVFARQTIGARNGSLLNHQVPAFNFDTIYGITYGIDPSQPPGARITDLRHDGRLIGARDQFIMATNHFRAMGGGGLPRTPEQRIRLRSDSTLYDALLALVSASEDDTWTPAEPWRLTSTGPLSTVLETTPDALGMLDDLAHMSPVSEGVDANGFARIRLHL